MIKNWYCQILNIIQNTKMKCKQPEKIIFPIFVWIIFAGKQIWT